jgi:hypothetical protein
MDGRIGQLHCRYRVLGERAAAPRISARLERVAREELLRSYETALHDAFGDDPAVIVVRQVDAGWVLSLDQVPTDAQLAQHWGRQLAGSVVRRVATARDDAAAVVRFENQADYVAHFLADLPGERAWGRWFYGAFLSYRSHTPGEAAYRVLLDHVEYVPEVLSRLHARGMLAAVLGLIDADALAHLWRLGVRRLDHAVVVPAHDEGRDATLFQQVVHLVDRLGLWSAARRSDAELLARYRPGVVVDWRDRHALTRAAVDVLDYLAREGQLASVATASDAAHWDAVLGDFDWLDTTRLRAVLRQNATPVTRPRGRHEALTPRQRALVDDLLVLLREPSASTGPDAAWALDLYARLVARSPAWGDDTLARRLVESLSRSRAAVGSRGAPIRDLLRQGRWDAARRALQGLDSGSGDAGDGAPMLTLLGAAAADLLEAMTGAASAERVYRHHATRCAGVWLLLRAMADLRLTRLAQRLDYPRGSADASLDVLLAVWLRLAGADALDGGRLDPGLAAAFTAGVTPPDFPRLCAHWASVEDAAHAAMQTAVREILAGQRLLSGDYFCIYKISLADGETALIGGDEAAGLWPYGCLLSPTLHRDALLADWVAQWTALRGRAPTALVLDPALPRATTRLGGVPCLCPTDTVAPVSDVASTFQRGRDALLAALSALDAGRLGVPAADLHVGLLAISVLRAWARWLPRFSHASIPYLLKNAVRRAGHLSLAGDVVEVTLEHAPLDAVLEMAGYMRDLDGPDIVLDRRVRFHLQG